MTTSATTRALASPPSTSDTPRSAAAAANKRLRKQCTTSGCSKVDAGGGFCVAHGGGKKCAFPGCRKGYQTGGFCRQHGGGARCQVEGCGKVDAGRGLCRAHGGGKRCQETGCTKADVGGGFCTAHGGGKRCSEPGCTKIDQGGGKCRAHGGARRCRHSGCKHPARGASGLCSDHGGAQLCATPNCRRIAKAEGGKFCTSCVKSQVKDEGSPYDDDPMDQDAKALMPPFGEMLARTSPQYEYSPMVVDSMEPFHAFVHAATTVDVTSPPQFQDDLHMGASNTQDEREIEEAQRFGSCLDNGCSKSFGGRCNCKTGCTCCSQAQLRSDEASSEATTTSTAESTPTAAASPSYLQLHHITLSLRACKLSVPIVRSVLTAVNGVRSVHFRLQDREAENDSAEANTSLITVLRCDPGFVSSDIKVLEQLSVQFEVLETSTVDWSLKEIVLKVPDMMCPGNCGRTVMNALLPISTIHTANLVFDERCVIARGDMKAQELCDKIEAVGFEPEVVAELPLPKRFVFRVVDFASVYLMGSRLLDLLQEVEGVETVLLAVNRAEVLVEGTLGDAGNLLQAAHTQGIMMVETQEDVRDIQTSPLDPTHIGRPSQTPTKGSQSNTSGGNDHVCDVKVCPHNGCEQYMVTVAHTAALAVGWSVPGCAMGWGGECTCGEQCKCAGCPEHNPLT